MGWEGRKDGSYGRGPAWLSLCSFCPIFPWGGRGGTWRRMSYLCLPQRKSIKLFYSSFPNMLPISMEVSPKLFQKNSSWHCWLAGTDHGSQQPPAAGKGLAGGLGSLYLAGWQSQLAWPVLKERRRRKGSCRKARLPQALKQASLFHASLPAWLPLDKL